MNYITSNEWIHKMLWKRYKNMSFMIENDDVVDKYNEI